MIIETVRARLAFPDHCRVIASDSSYAHMSSRLIGTLVLESIHHSDDEKTGYRHKLPVFRCIPIFFLIFYFFGTCFISPAWILQLVIFAVTCLHFFQLLRLVAGCERADVCAGVRASYARQYCPNELDILHRKEKLAETNGIPLQTVRGPFRRDGGILLTLPCTLTYPRLQHQLRNGRSASPRDKQLDASSRRGNKQGPVVLQKHEYHVPRRFAYSRGRT